MEHSLKFGESAISSNINSNYARANYELLAPLLGCEISFVWGEYSKGQTGVRTPLALALPAGKYYVNRQQQAARERRVSRANSNKRDRQSKINERYWLIIHFEPGVG